MHLMENQLLTATRIFAERPKVGKKEMLVLTPGQIVPMTARPTITTTMVECRKDAADGILRAHLRQKEAQDYGWLPVEDQEDTKEVDGRSAKIRTDIHGPSTGVFCEFLTAPSGRALHHTTTSPVTVYDVKMADRWTTSVPYRPALFREVGRWDRYFGKCPAIMLWDVSKRCARHVVEVVNAPVVRATLQYLRGGYERMLGIAGSLANGMPSGDLFLGLRPVEDAMSPPEMSREELPISEFGNQAWAGFSREIIDDELPASILWERTCSALQKLNNHHTRVSAHL